MDCTNKLLIYVLSNFKIILTSFDVYHTNKKIKVYLLQTIHSFVIYMSKAENVFLFFKKIVSLEFRSSFFLDFNKNINKNKKYRGKHAFNSKLGERNRIFTQKKNCKLDNVSVDDWRSLQAKVRKAVKATREKAEAYSQRNTVTAVKCYLSTVTLH